jgi:hypothetical protein
MDVLRAFHNVPWMSCALLQFSCQYACITSVHQVRWSVFDFVVIVSLVITSILTTTFNQDFNNRRRPKCSNRRSFERLHQTRRWLQCEPKHVVDVVCYQYLTCCVWQYTPTKLLFRLRWHYSPMWTFRPLNGLLPFTSVCDFPFQFIILYLLLSACTQLVHRLFCDHPLSQRPWRLFLNA